jgi:hypothetical protein
VQSLEVRIFYPRNDTPLFAYPAISMRDYDWSQKSLSDKIAEQFLVMLGFICFGYFGLTIAAHRLITWSDLNWDFAWGIIKCLLILALFPIIIV